MQICKTLSSVRSGRWCIKDEPRWKATHICLVKVIHCVVHENTKCLLLAWETDAWNSTFLFFVPDSLLLNFQYGINCRRETLTCAYFGLVCFIYLRLAENAIFRQQVKHILPFWFGERPPTYQITRFGVSMQISTFIYDLVFPGTAGWNGDIRISSKYESCLYFPQVCCFIYKLPNLLRGKSVIADFSIVGNIWHWEVLGWACSEVIIN